MKVYLLTAAAVVIPFLVATPNKTDLRRRALEESDHRCAAHAPTTRPALDLRDEFIRLSAELDTIDRR